MEIENYAISGCAGKSIINPERADWFINYDVQTNETALVICGADGIGVLFLILKNNHIEDFETVIKQYEGFNKNIHGCLGECIRWAVQQSDIIPERCTIGGIGPNLIRFTQTKNYERLPQED